jgi:hypothetical protein
VCTSDLFITPYRTSIGEDDLIFGQGDFNVDVVVALGVHEREDLDQAIVSHGRILHDANVISINTQQAGALGTINWTDAQASSLSEMLVDVGQQLQADVLDAQMATAFLTGIVAETARFSNEKTTSATMAISAKLMAAGANQQLVATKLKESADMQAATPQSVVDTPTNGQDVPNTQQPADDGNGALQIDHQDQDQNEQSPVAAAAADPFSLPPLKTEDYFPQDNGTPVASVDQKEPADGAHFMQPDANDSSTMLPDEESQSDPEADMNPLNQPLERNARILSHDTPPAPEPGVPATPAEQPVPEAQLPPEEVTVPEASAEQPVTVPEPPVVEEPPQPEVPPEASVPPATQPTETSTPTEPVDTTTLSDLEQSVDSPHVETATEQTEAAAPTEPVAAEATRPDPREALAAVDAAIKTGDNPLEPLQALNANPVDIDLGHAEPEAPANPDVTAVNQDQPTADAAPSETTASIDIDPLTGEIKLPENLVPPSDELPPDSTATSVTDPTAPPPVPPPMMPPVMPPADDGQDGALPPPPTA